MVAGFVLSESCRVGAAELLTAYSIPLLVLLCDEMLNLLGAAVGPASQRNVNSDPPSVSWPHLCLWEEF